MNISALSKAHFEVSRQQFNCFVARSLIPGTSYYVASLMRGASEESLENKSKILSRLLTVGWVAGAAICAVGSVIANILVAPLNLVGRLIQLKLVRAVVEFSLAILHAVQNIFFIATTPLIILFAILYPKGTVGPLFSGQAWENGALNTHPEYIKQPAKVIDAGWKSDISTKESFSKSIEKFVEFKSFSSKTESDTESADSVSTEIATSETSTVTTPIEEKTLLPPEKKKKLDQLQTQLGAIAVKQDKRFTMHCTIDNKPQTIVLSMANRGHLLLLQEIIAQAVSAKKTDALNSIKIQSDFRQQETFLTEMNCRFNPLAPQVNRSHEGKYLISLQVMLSQILDNEITPFGNRKLAIDDFQRYFQPEGAWSNLQKQLETTIADHIDLCKPKGSKSPFFPKVVFLQNLKKTLDTLVMGVQENPRHGYQQGILLLNQTIESLATCEAMQEALEFYNSDTNVKVEDLTPTQKSLFEKGKSLNTSLTEDQKNQLTPNDTLGNHNVKEIVQQLCIARFAHVPMHDYKQEQVQMVHGDLPGQTTDLTLDNFYEKFKEVNSSLFKRSPVHGKSFASYAKQCLSGNTGLGFHPIANQSVPHVHGLLERKDGQRTEILQHSTPTIQKGPIDLLTKTVKISSDYEFWINTCKENDQKILSIIHESCEGVEGIRQNARMNLAKRYDNFYAITLPCEGPLYNGYKADMSWPDFKAKLISAFEEPEAGKKNPLGVVVSDNIRNILTDTELSRILDETKSLFFFGEDEKITSARQYHALLGLFYVHLAEQLEDLTHFDFLHMACKDDTDRGGTLKAIFAIYHLLASNASKEQIATSLQDILIEYTGQGWMGKKQGVLLKRAVLLEEVLELMKGKNKIITAAFAKLKAQEEYKIIQYPHGVVTGPPYSSFVVPGLKEGHSAEQTKRLFKDQSRFTLDPSSWLHQADFSFENIYASDLSELKVQFIKDLKRPGEEPPQFFCNNNEISKAAVVSALACSDSDPDEAIHQFLSLFFPERSKDHFTNDELQLMTISSHAVHDYYIKLLNPLFQSVDHKADLATPLYEKAPKKVLSKEEQAKVKEEEPEALMARRAIGNQQIYIDTTTPALQIDLLGTVAQLRNTSGKEINFPVHISIDGKKALFVIVPEVFGYKSNGDALEDESLKLSPEFTKQEDAVSLPSSLDLAPDANQIVTPDSPKSQEEGSLISTGSSDPTEK